MLERIFYLRFFCTQVRRRTFFITAGEHKVLHILHGLGLSLLVELVKRGQQSRLPRGELNSPGKLRRKTILVQEIWLNLKNIKNSQKDIPLGTTNAVFIVTNGTFCNAELFSKILLSKPGLFACLPETTGKRYREHLLKNYRSKVSINERS